MARPSVLSLPVVGLEDGGWGRWLGSLQILKRFTFYLLVCFTCVRPCPHEYLCTMYVQEPMEYRRGCQVPWIWSSRWLYIFMGVLEAEFLYSARAVSSLSCWAISATPRRLWHRQERVGCIRMYFLNCHCGHPWSWKVCIIFCRWAFTFPSVGSQATCFTGHTVLPFSANGGWPKEIHHLRGHGMKCQADSGSGVAWPGLTF